MASTTEDTAEIRLPCPPLPTSVREPRRGSSASGPKHREGCYLLNFEPSSFVIYDGTLRVESKSGPLFASGDLYLRGNLPDKPNEQLPNPDPAEGIPSFPIGAYRYYLRVTQLEEDESGIILAFEAHRYGAEVLLLLRGTTTHWFVEGTFTAQLKQTPAPMGYPDPERFFVGDLLDDDGFPIGQLQMGWVSSHLRKATIEIDRDPISEIPRDNGAEHTWDTIFESVGWDVTIMTSNEYVTKPSGPVWTAPEAHTAMEKHRAKDDLDAEWRYHILAVQLIDFPDGDRGVMFDFSSNDINRVAREGLMVASHFKFLPEIPKWGLVRGKRAGETVTYFRTAVHEMGHAMGLPHNNRDCFFMRPTDMIAAEAPAERPFPTNVKWSYAPLDEHRLRHWPDLVVRPGGISLGSSGDAPVS